MVRIGLVQINSSFSGQRYFPYSVGILQAYAMRHLRVPRNYEFLLPIYRRITVAEAVAHLRDVDIVFFSAYVWNVRLSLAIADALKRKDPEVMVVFGGPQVPRSDRPWEVEWFFRRNPFVDLAVHGMGEQPFVSILEHGPGGEWDQIPSISFLGKDGLFHQTARGQRFKDLADVPQPYTDGVFDELMAANPHEQWIGLAETDRNCPFSCTFCGWGLLESKPIQWPLEEVYKVIDWFGRNKIRYVFFANANFGLLPRDIEIARFLVETKRRYGFPEAVSVQDTKNVKERAYAVRKILMETFSSPVVLSLQSVDPVALENVRRDNISLDDFFEIQRRFTEQGIDTMTDLILGLPGETYDSFATGVSTIIEKGQHNRIQFNNLSMVPDAEISHPIQIEHFGMVTTQSQIVNIHGKVESDEVPELQELVVATSAMPKEDWVWARRFAWMVALLHFDKVLQIPLVLAHEVGRVSYCELIELFAQEALDVRELPILAEIQEFFAAKARDIQAGGVEYCHAPAWLNIYWPADEYILIRLAVDGKLDQFYKQAERRLLSRVQVSPAVIHDAVVLNQSLLKLPFQNADLELECSSNVWEFYRAVLVGNPIPLERGPYKYWIDRTSEQWWSWEEWFEKVIWWGNRRGAYLYGNKPLGMELAGHF